MSAGAGGRTWRLVVDERSLSGAWNMALDRALQLECAEGGSPPTLRLYGWARPTLTLGHFQSLDGIDLAACEAEGVDVVRRFTGGRAVLHDDEVTYAIVASESDGVPRGTAASYRYLCGALVEAYEELGVSAELTARPRGNRSSAACYLHATNADLSLGARKLSGSAQVWHRQTVLQHGSLVLSRDTEREGRVLTLGPKEVLALQASTATIGDALAEAPSRERLQRALVEGFERSFGISLTADGYTEAEVRRAEGLLTEVEVAGERAPAPEGASG